LLSSDLYKVLNKRSIKDFKPLKTKAFDFKKNDTARQMSANNILPQNYGEIP